MAWDFERKRRAAIEAPRAMTAPRPDTRVIEREGWFQSITPSSPGSFRNEVVHSAVAASDAERVIDEAVALYHTLGKPVKWCVGPWTKPDDFGERLARRGFVSWAVSGMGIATDASLPPSRAHAHVHVREAASADEIVEYTRASLAAWEMAPDDVDAESAAFGEGARSRQLHLFVAELDGVAVGAGAYALRDDYAYLLGTAVLGSARGQGVYRALVAARLAHLRDRGVAYAVTHARDATSAPILERLGFERLFRSQCWVLSAPAASRPNEAT